MSYIHFSFLFFTPFHPLYFHPSSAFPSSSLPPFPFYLFFYLLRYISVSSELEHIRTVRLKNTYLILKRTLFLNNWGVDLYIAALSQNNLRYSLQIFWSLLPNAEAVTVVDW